MLYNSDFCNSCNCLCGSCSSKKLGNAVLRYILPPINTSQLTAELRAGKRVELSCKLSDCNQNVKVWYVVVGLVQLICMTSIVLSNCWQHFIAEAWKNYGKRHKILSRKTRNACNILIKYLFEWSHLKD